MILRPDDLLQVYGAKREKHSEAVVAVGRYKGDGVLPIPKIQWTRSLKGVTGLSVSPPNMLLPTGRVSRQISIAQKTLKTLDVSGKALLCITQKGTDRFLKVLRCKEMDSQTPGWMVIDQFSPTQVTRWWSSNPGMESITQDFLNRLLESVGRFRVDPIPAICRLSSDALLPQKKELLGQLTTGEEKRLAAYVNSTRKSHDRSGSWRNSAVWTAGSVIRILQCGIPATDPTVKRALDWLEKCVEPYGLPGLFMCEEEIGREHNRRRSTGGPALTVPHHKRRAHLDKLSSEYFTPFLDLLPKFNRACEPHTTWATAIALQALLRAGRSTSPRVAKALKTLLQWRCSFDTCGGWCGCGLLGGSLEESWIRRGGDVDFDSAKLPESNRDLAFATWFLKKANLPGIVCNPYAENYWCMRISDDSGLLLRNRLSAPDSNCTTVLQDALSWHPGYHGTRLEQLAAYELCGMQNPNGDWPSHHVSSMLHFLSSIIESPLAAFLAYRSLPALIRSQKDNGLWYSHDGNENVNDIVLLRALDRMGLLEQLRPGE